MAEFITAEPEPQQRDTLGLVAGLIFAAVGLGYLIGGDDALSGHSGVVLPAVLILLGLVGLAGSSVVRGQWRRANAAAAVPNSGDNPEEGPAE
jgi:drug/metabolite transporter (DMT)-like permease